MKDSRYERACARFLEAVGAGVDAVLDVGYAELGHPIHLLDPGFKLIRSVGGEGLRDPRWLEYESAEACISEEQLIEIRKSGFLSRVWNSRKPTVATNEKEAYAVIAYDIRSGERLFGRLGVWARKPYDEGDIDIVYAMSKALTAEMGGGEKSALETGRDGSFFLESLLGGGSGNRAEIERLRKRCGLELSPPYRIRVVSARDGSGEAGTAPRFLARKIGPLMPDALCAVENGELIVLASRGDQKGEEKIPPFIRKNALFSGLSRRFDDLADASEAFRQARFALSFCSAEAREVDYELVAHRELLRACAAALPPLCRDFPPVARLEAHDAEFRTEYLRTLAAYLDRRCGMAETARALGVHYNTVKYRLRAMEELMGLRIEGLETILKTCVALLLRRDGERGDSAR